VAMEHLSLSVGALLGEPGWRGGGTPLLGTL